MHQMHICDNICLLSDAQAEKFGDPKCYDCKQGALKWSQIEGQSLHEEDNPFVLKWIYFIFFLDNQIHIHTFKHVQKCLATGL
jgi:hypothetical protein